MSYTDVAQNICISHDTHKFKRSYEFVLELPSWFWTYVLMSI